MAAAKRIYILTKTLNKQATVFNLQTMLRHSHVKQVVYFLSQRFYKK